MSNVIIRALLEVHLNAIAPNIATAFENVPFAPVNGTPWQRVNLLTAQTLNPTFGGNFHRETGIFQVMLAYPENAGAAAAATRAELIRLQFVRGTTLTSGSLRVLIDRWPWSSQGVNDGGWYRLPVSIPYIADVYL